MKHSADSRLPAAAEVGQETASAANPLGRLSRLGLGAAVMAAGTLGRALGEHEKPLHGPGDPVPAQEAVDVAVGIADVLTEALTRVFDTSESVTRPVREPTGRLGKSVLAVMMSPFVSAVAPAVEGLAERGRARRAVAEQEVVGAVQDALPTAVAAVLEQIDLTEYALQHLDMERVLVAAFEQVDVVQIMVDNVDMDELLEATMDRVDVTSLALRHVNLQRVVEQTLAQVDMVGIVRSQLDGMDLSEIVRTAPTSVASEALRQTTAGAGRAVSALGRVAGAGRGRPARTPDPEQLPAGTDQS